MEQKASLPPIIEDESDDNLMPLLYRKELSRHQHRDNSNSTEQAMENANSTLSSSNNSDIINATQLPYNSWKSKFCLKKPDSIDSLDMQSKLGQRLESSHIVGVSQIKPTPQTGDHFYPPNQNPVEVRHVDPTFTNQGGFRVTSNYSEQEKCAPQQFQDVKSFNFSYNETPKGYFPEHNRKPFREYARNGENSYRNFQPEYVPDQYRYLTPERSYNQVNSYSAFGKPSHNSFSPQHVSPNAFNHTNYNGASHTSPGCCSNGPAIPPNGTNFYPPYRNPELEHSTNQLIKSLPEASSCNCHVKSEIRDKKREKLDKVRKKQISDLYRIVWLQNEQIIQVQNQLKKLIQVINERSDEKPKRSHDPEHTPKVSHKGTSEKRMFNLSVIEENKNLMEKVSVGIMTSFIDTTKVTKKGQSKNVKGKSRKATQKSSSSSSSSDENSSSSSSEEEDDTECLKKQSQKKKKSGKPYEDSIILNGIEIPTVADNKSPSSSPPMQIELNDYDSTSNSSESNTSEESEDDSPVPPVGWTFYDKVVGKVNNMLNKSESESNSDAENQRKTVEQIRKLGMNLEQESPNSKRVTFNSPYQQKALLPDSDTSMKMNALAVKYYKEDKSPPQEEEFNYKEVERYQNNVVNNTNLSYATMRYLERYHLPKFAQSPDKVEKEKKSKKKKEKIQKEEKYEDKKSHKKKSKSGQHSGKILDITAIKQQPKLLPKKQ